MALVNHRHGQSHAGAYTSVEDLLQLRYIAKDLTLQTRKKSSAIMDGDSRSSFRGRGMEFAEVRPYQAGDDVRNIDWRVTARTQKPYTKLFQEERERPVFIVVDQRASMFFGSANVFKSVYVAQLASIISWTALQNNDRIGALIFSDNDQNDLRARRGKHGVLAFLHQLHTYNTRLNSPVVPGKTISIAEMISDIRRVAKPGSAIYILSDFHDFNRDCEESLATLSRHTDITAIQVYDSLEKQLPDDNQLTISDTQQRLTISAKSSAFLQQYAQHFRERQSLLRKACTRSGITFAATTVDKTIDKLAIDLFASRQPNKADRGRR